MLYLFLKIIIKNIIKNIMENIKLNKEQEKIINNFVNKNACFVNASAGTGKTTTITEVYIKLLESGEKVSNIIVQDLKNGYLGNVTFDRLEDEN